MTAPARAVLLAALLLPPLAVAARTTAPAPVARVVASSDRAVLAEVVALETRAEPRRVRTTYTLRVLRPLVGTAPPTLTLTLPGGRVGEHIVQVHGVPVWREGDRVVASFRGGAPDLDGLLTVEGPRLHDPWQRPAPAVPPTLEALSAAVMEARGAPDIADEDVPDGL